jgi:hypothetical protein
MTDSPDNRGCQSFCLIYEKPLPQEISKQELSAFGAKGCATDQRYPEFTAD